MNRLVLLSLPVLALSACGIPLSSPSGLAGVYARFTPSALQACGTIGWYLKVSAYPAPTHPLTGLTYRINRYPGQTDVPNDPTPATMISSADDYLFSAYDPNGPNHLGDFNYVNTFTCMTTGQQVTTDQIGDSNTTGPALTVDYAGTLTVTLRR